jgi:Ca2+-transporting ATPase
VAVQILWINLITDSLLVIPLGLEPGHEEIMKRPPNSPKSPILSRRSIGLMVILAVATAGVTLGAYIFLLRSHTVEYARTMAFLVLIFTQIIVAWTVRSMHESVFHYRVHNRKFFLAVVISFVAQGLVMFTSFGEMLFKLVDLDVTDLAIVLIITTVLIIGTTEVYKYFIRRRAMKSS